VSLVEFPMVRLATPVERLKHGLYACAMTVVLRDGPEDAVTFLEIVIIDDGGASLAPTAEDRALINISHESLHAAIALIGERERYPGGPVMVDVISRDERAMHGYLSTNGITGGCARGHWSRARRQRRLKFLAAVERGRVMPSHSTKGLHALSENPMNAKQNDLSASARRTSHRSPTSQIQKGSHPVCGEVIA
jgi:hypothetical protein